MTLQLNSFTAKTKDGILKLFLGNAKACEENIVHCLELNSLGNWLQICYVGNDRHIIFFTL